MGKIKDVQELEAWRDRLLAACNPEQPVVRVCSGPGCLAQGADQVAKAFKAAARKGKFKVAPLIKETGCQGLCSKGTLVNLTPADIFYVRVQPQDVPEIVETSLAKNGVVERLLYRENGKRCRSAADIPFYRLQEKVVLKNVGDIDPLSFEDAVAAGAYQSMARALTRMTPDEVIETVRLSGLRGRGGGGFPTGYKWRLAADQARQNPGSLYIIANGEEGDPGAFMDRAIMEGDPHTVIEGMIIGAYAMGSQQGFLYVRHEYPIALHHLTIAIKQARRHGLLGRNILGTGFSFDLEIHRGAGAYVCGEETAIIASLEGRVGVPVTRPPYPAEQGLWGRPTIINNVETWANVPHIIDKGAEWYAGLGVPHSTGTKIFSLVGKVNNTGLVEVPMGTTLGRLVEEIGGGVPGQARFKAVQTGGPSGGIIPYEFKDVSTDDRKLSRGELTSQDVVLETSGFPVEFESFVQAGSILGGGGMIVMDDKDCVVDLARYFLNFLGEESCGKCLPCRLGLRGMLEFLDKFAKGQGSPEDLESLVSLAEAVMDGSLCGLGRRAPSSILTSIRYFRDEYLAHIMDHKCPAGVCQDLISYRIDPASCTGCSLCLNVCPQDCITGKKNQPHAIDSSACSRCGACLDVCPEDAVLTL